MTKTAAQQAGFEVGDRAIMNGSSTFADGSLVELVVDDKTAMPLWKLINGWCDHWNCSEGSKGGYADIAYATPLNNYAELNSLTLHYTNGDTEVTVQTKNMALFRSILDVLEKGES